MGETKQAMLKRVKEEYSGTSSKANQHIVKDKKGEDIAFSKQADLPELPVLYVQNCESCNIQIHSSVTLVKLLIEGCKQCVVNLEGTVSTETLELWSSEACSVLFRTPVKTVQLDLSKGVTLQFAKKENFGSVVQAGVRGLHVLFGDAPMYNDHTDYDKLKESHPDINDQTDQFISRIVDGKYLTERIVRLKNDFPTTEREQKDFEREASEKNKVMEDMANKMLGANLDASQQAQLQEKVNALGGGEGGIATDKDRAEFKKKLGNEAFKNGEALQAAAFYTEAIVLDDSNHVLYSNRAACFLQTGHYQKALDDCDRCVSLNSGFVKGHFRRGLALNALELFKDACGSFSRALELDPKNGPAKASLQMSEMKLQKQMKAQG
mmetsp:Transcript_24199/g.29346  ORF Transcript_24199/g.29346 Transcript_24199/m.29346 type:complete len:380 (-) Transcript_24199:123-1262(-)|eukprot:CAMPEP_0197851782 /NCGR_PEP_ID=MMETSP1438-20131217/18839_1 /TAXON_ID=1461541 /ORGANISM="Pterosperma sp., Strain CCMP1384" /LENGTH=379 /DNA_ID=CAMNT_0043465509 /DNA_START=120 /DNA_END=1259 /DNA_ORIENTATION=-